MATRLISVLGLGFGDCGKGLFIDALCRSLQAHTVVRFNGGAQAGHNVVLPDGRHHTFSQFGAGSFIAGVRTLLSYPVVVHPTALLVENDYLRRAGVHDGLHRMVIDQRCKVTTPFHQAVGRMRELRRGQNGHGSCGVGVGETVRQDLERPELTLRYGDLLDTAGALDKLEALRVSMLAEFDPHCLDPDYRAAYVAELDVLRDASVARQWLARTMELLAIVPPALHAEVAACFHRPGVMLFEGAQGVLLDEWRGFHPHTSWSTIHPSAVEAVAADAGQHARIQHLGALRSYMTRHGNGPLPSHDPRLSVLREPHNASGGWQGGFRRGHPDAVLLRYALSVTGPLDGLLLSHLDAFEHQPQFAWCKAYSAPLADNDERLCQRDAAGRVATLRPSPGHDLDHQAGLARLLSSATPWIESNTITTAEQFIDEIEALASLRVALGSFGPTFETVRTFNRLY
jgi:adenylosuccinate synthase